MRVLYVCEWCCTVYAFTAEELQETEDEDTEPPYRLTVCQSCHTCGRIKPLALLGTANARPPEGSANAGGNKKALDY